MTNFPLPGKVDAREMHTHPPWLSINFHLRGQLAAVIDAPLQIQAVLSAAVRISIPISPPEGGKLGAPGGHALKATGSAVNN